jgi:hypothetical protein
MNAMLGRVRDGEHTWVNPRERRSPERFIQQIDSFLASAPPAWDPYDRG